MRRILHRNKKYLICNNKDFSNLPNYISRWAQAHATKHVWHLTRSRNRNNTDVFNKRNPSIPRRTRSNNRVNKTSPIKDEEDVDAEQEDAAAAEKICKILNGVITKTRRGTTLRQTTKDKIRVFKDQIKIYNLDVHHIQTRKRNTKTSSIVSHAGTMSIMMVTDAKMLDTTTSRIFLGIEHMQCRAPA